MNELALFAGAGGGVLASYLLGWRTVCAVERDAYAAQVLAQRQNDGILEAFPIWSDITTLTENHGKELLTLYLAAFRAKTSHPRGKVLESKVNVLGFGQKWHELLVKYDLDTCSWKTHQCLFPEDLHESSVTLPKWGMTRNGHVFQHLTLERPISVTESGLWATPLARDFRSGQSQRWDNPHRSRNLNDQVAKFPTPKASDGNKRGKVSNHPRNGLAGVVENLPTPTASMSKGSSPATLTRKDGKSRVNDRLDHHVMNSHGGKLNPNWVEWLMGWPIGWTDLRPLEMDKFQSWLNAHLNFRWCRMNYYQHHIGDFNNATRHLSLIERAIYRDLLDMYYDTEKAIDATSIDRLARRLQCTTEEQKKLSNMYLMSFHS